jgi:RHS repeat-associated protein
MLLIVLQTNAQIPVSITKENTYTVTGDETLVASESIILKPNSWIKSGSTFIARIESDAYRSILLSNENYIFTRVFQNPMDSSLGINKDSDVMETITYLDGLGRPIQNIAIKASPSKQDIITPIEYDSIGRQKKEYLPYMDYSINLASYRMNAINVINDYYKINYPTDVSSILPNPYSQKQFEKSPLNRVLKLASPGSDWALGSGHEIKLDYQTNGENEVKQFKVSTELNNTIDSKIYASPYYPSGQLYKTITKDENWIPSDGNNKTTHEFKDKEGHVVLKRTFAESLVNNILTNTHHDIYYVYDEYGNLIYVIPPLTDTNALMKSEFLTNGYNNFSKNIHHSAFSGTMEGGGSVGVTIEDNVLKVKFSAGYIPSFLINAPQDLLTTPCELPDMELGLISNGDYRASIVSGKLKLTTITGAPSSGFNATFSVNLPNSCTKYADEPDFTILENLCYQYKYDTKNRLVEKKLPGKEWEYIVYDKLDRPILTQDANLKKLNKWIFIKYDAFSRPAYTGEYTNAIENNRAAVQNLANKSVVFESKLATPINIAGTDVNYTNVAFPNIDIDLFTINYYDNYNFDLEGGTVVLSYGILPISNAKGLVTGSKVRILGTPNWTTNVDYYDDKGRLIYNYSKNNYLETVSTTKKQLDFGGKVLETTTAHKKGITVEITILDTFTYDHIGRILTQKQKINNQPQEIIAANSYDNLGQLLAKDVGGSGISSLQTINYGYNIRGWLKKINDLNVMGTDLFAFEINYNTPTTGTGLYNGNISQTLWKTTNSDSSLRSYTYSYDALNRLKFATHNLGHYDENPTYDKNGNIMNLFRNGNTVLGTSNFGVIDNLVYTYDKGNRLLKVEDVSGNTEGFKDGANMSIEYTYDNNGNIITDTNKGISNITYNHLNLPTLVSLSEGGISYVYDATGIKQRKIVGSIITDYANGFQYENNILQFFPQSEGYVNNNSGTFEYIYQYKDHLGNVRLSYDKNLSIVDENNYYPFGLKQIGYNNNISSLGNAAAKKYKYNGKELQDENIGGNQLNLYDYGARNYDPAIGRWMNIDPLAENSRRWTPYNYAYNNPIFFIDPDGMQADDWKTDANGNMVFDANLTKENASTQLKAGESYVGSSFIAKDQNENIYSFNSDGSVDASQATEFMFKASGIDTSSMIQVESSVSVGKGVDVAQPQMGNILLSITATTATADALTPDPSDVAAIPKGIGYGIAATAALITGIILEKSDVVMSFAQRGSNNGKLQDDELESITARKAAGTASSSDLQKLKKHEKNTGARNSRQSKDKK